jgi:hypothetical protein
MKVRQLLLFFFFTLTTSTGLFAQNLFPEKIDICGDMKYCMDCGTPKAICDSFTLDNISARINYRYNFKGGFGTIAFQVLVDSTGFSCVLSHTDATHSQLTNELIIYLNTCRWRPARVDGKKVNASVNVVFTIANSRITGQMQRLDLTQLAAAESPTVYNQQYHYYNPSLSKYNISVLTKYNSPLPDNVSHFCVMDKTDTLWYATERGLTKYDGKAFHNINETNSPFTSTMAVKAMAVDKSNNVWMYANTGIYMAENNRWKVFDSAHFGVSSAYRIVTNPTGEVFFTNKRGLLIVRNDKVRLIDKNLVWQLPSNNVYYAYFDSRERLWIGTDRGTILIDKKKNVTVFNKTNGPLKDVCITNIVEDDKGNLYFSSKSCKKEPGDNDEEGLAVMSADGKWAHYNDKNSGLPANQVNSIYVR